MQHPQFAAVLLDQGIDHPLDYQIPSPVSVGTRVLVPVKGAMRKGTVIALKKSPSVPKVQPIEKVLSEQSVLSSQLLTLAHGMSEYYCTSLRKVLRVLLPAPLRKEIGPKKQLFVRPLLSSKKLANLAGSLRNTSPCQAKVLDLLLEHPKGLFLQHLLEKTRTSKSPLCTLEKQNILLIQEVQVNRSPLEEMEFFPTKPKQLNAEQREALNSIIAHLKTFQIHLIHGVTGSGKTEIYLQAIASARAVGLGVILLVPEIALTSQTIERLKSRFTEKLGVFHHRMSLGERFDTWDSIQKGSISIVIGARSAVFSPVQNLGLIIIDEEHESSYKQTEEEPCYHARTIAIMRARIEQATVVLGSATPSLESYARAKKGTYHLSTLTRRASHALQPKVILIDMESESAKSKGHTLFSAPLINGIRDRLEKGEQTLLFLNRRGYHTFQLCTQCKVSLKCPHCSVSLTFHKQYNHLICHLCQYSLSPPPLQCPNCKAFSTLMFKGVGTEQVERVLHALLPRIRTLRMDADTTRRKGSHDLLLKQFKSGKADVLIGTQMIAKGLHFPSVTLVGVLNSDGALHLPDFRASETVFQLLTQVSGRSGRGVLEGEVMIQTFLKDHPIFRYAAAGDYEGFFKEEVGIRKAFKFPPFSRLAKLTFSGKNALQVKESAQTLFSFLLKKLPPSFTLYPPIPSGHAKVKDHFRFALLVKGNHPFLLSEILRDIRCRSLLPLSVRLLIDIDPISTFL